MKITLRPDAEPYCLTTARIVAFPLLPKVEAALQQLDHKGIIEKTKKPTDWCSPMMDMLKKNGMRIYVDLK